MRREQSQRQCKYVTAVNPCADAWVSGLQGAILGFGFIIAVGCSTVSLSETPSSSKISTDRTTVVNSLVKTSLSQRYIRLDAQGDRLGSPTPRTWPCVLDNQSQLIWEVKSDSAGLQSTHNSYSWFYPDLNSQLYSELSAPFNEKIANTTTSDADITNTGSLVGYRNAGNCSESECDTAGYITAINKLKLCGLGQWRLPSRAELKTLVDYRILYPGPTIDQDYFPHSSPQFYWSATMDVNDPDSAWGVGFSFGYDYAYFKSDRGRVRLVHDAPGTHSAHTPSRYSVHAGQYCLPVTLHTSTLASTTSYVDNRDGTVTDSSKGLMWMRCSLGQQWQDDRCRGEAQLEPYQHFVREVGQIQFAGYRDWRIPTVKELDSITELQCERPAINLDLFPGTVSGNYWSVTTFANDSSKQWLVHFLYGENTIELKSAAALLRLVRDVHGNSDLE